jgi:sterol desaturase/sphingolipid hydroxylase (fatty acid hydroxylase superfamily)
VTQNQFETWMPLLAITIVIFSLVLHAIKPSVHQMTLKETLANIGIFIGWRFIFFAGGVALQFWIFTKISQWIPWKLPSAPWVILLAVFIADFFYYWRHRVEHRMNFLWAQHSVHHSSEEYNLSTSLRLPWVASYLNWPFLVPALLFGFSASQLIMGYQVILAYQYLIHTEYVGNLGFLEKFLNTPSHHRVHHGKNEEYLDKNYGGLLIIWDRLFGSFTREANPVEYGTVHPIQTKNPFLINFFPWKDLFKMSKTLTGLRQKTVFWLIAPASTEAYLKKRSAP